VGRIRISCILVALIAGLVAVAAYAADFFEPFERDLADVRFQVAADSSRWPSEVVVVYIDQRSLNRAQDELGLGRMPIGRFRIGRSSVSRFP
jgi:CHASE2 domain-containing sensor protein